LRLAKTYTGMYTLAIDNPLTGKESLMQGVMCARVTGDERVQFTARVHKMKPPRSVSARIRELIIQDIKKGAKKCTVTNVAAF